MLLKIVYVQDKKLILGKQINHFNLATSNIYIPATETI